MHLLRRYKTGDTPLAPSFSPSFSSATRVRSFRTRLLVSHTLPPPSLSSSALLPAPAEDLLIPLRRTRARAAGISLIPGSSRHGSLLTASDSSLRGNFSRGKRQRVEGYVLRAGWPAMFVPKQMVLRGSFIPEFQVASPRLAQVVVKKGTRHRASCATKISSSLWETLPTTYCRIKNVGVQCKDSSINVQQSTVPGTGTSKLSELAFDKLQVSDEEICKGLKRAFGRFVARGALVDEEYWTASWLRAEAHWESMSYMRHIDSYKRKYAEQEFYALKRRCTGREANLLKCLCIVTVKKEDPNARRTVLNSVVGTLDLSIRQFLHGEKFPGEFKRTCCVLATHDDSDTHRYAYISNVCVSKFARRQGIASNMLHLATDIAISSGMQQLFVHVNADNRAAQDLYRKIGFEIVEEGSSSLSKDQRVLMCLEL